MAMEFEAKDIDYLLSPKAIRDRTRIIFDLAISGQTHFKVNLDRLEGVSDYVLEVIQERYPNMEIPFHSRHTHLNAGNVDRLRSLNQALQGKSKLELAKAQIELVVVSVLLDAGAGDHWQYLEKSTQKNYSRSEGLAVASFHAFMAGAFSGQTAHPCQADMMGLREFSVGALKNHFQVDAENPLIGLEGRAHLINQLAEVIAKHPRIFKTGRLGDFLDYLLEIHPKEIRAADVLNFVLRYFADIWPSRLRLGEQNLGDVWAYSAIGPKHSTKSLVPFHKLSQWLTYSLLVPMMDMGLTISGVDDLTGLAEYRNGGLLLDSGLIELRDLSLQSQKHTPDSELIIEWRALTVVALDLIADKIRQKLHLTKDEMPLVKILEGGTWHAGRKIAREKRTAGDPPLNILSDGTVF